jgi:hypothetical protein
MINETLRRVLGSGLVEFTDDEKEFQDQASISPPVGMKRSIPGFCSRSLMSAGTPPPSWNANVGQKRSLSRARKYRSQRMRPFRDQLGRGRGRPPR